MDLKMLNLESERMVNQFYFLEILIHRSDNFNDNIKVGGHFPGQFS